jgi:hypothetical protein
LPIGLGWAFQVQVVIFIGGEVANRFPLEEHGGLPRNRLVIRWFQ